MGSRCRAFTLVELLVVIGIISVLIAILLPVLAKVRQEAAATKCMTNLKGMAQAFMAYAQSNNGVVPPGRLPKTDINGNTMPDSTLGTQEQYRPRWYELLGAIVKQYACDKPGPLQDDSWTIRNPWYLCSAVPEWNNSRNYPYGYNYQFLGNAKLKKPGEWIKYPVKISSLKGSETVMAMDCMGTAAGKPKGQRVGYLADGSKDLYAVANKGVFVDPPRLTATSDYADPQHRQPQHRSGPDPRHGGKVVVAFCDGHVDRLSVQQLGYVMNPDGSMPVDGPGVTNRYFSGDGTDKDPPAAN